MAAARNPPRYPLHCFCEEVCKPQIVNHYDNHEVDNLRRSLTVLYPLKEDISLDRLFNNTLHGIVVAHLFKKKVRETTGYKQMKSYLLIIRYCNDCSMYIHIICLCL